MMMTLIGILELHVLPLKNLKKQKKVSYKYKMKNIRAIIAIWAGYVDVT